MYLESGTHMQQESFGRAVNGAKSSASGPPVPPGGRWRHRILGVDVQFTAAPQPGQGGPSLDSAVVEPFVAVQAVDVDTVSAYRIRAFLRC